MNTKHFFLIVAIPALFLSACGGGGDNNFTPPPTGTVVIPPVPPPPTPPTPPPTPDSTPQAAAGAGFATAFNANQFDEPRNPIMGDIIALDKMAEPTDIANP